MGTISSFFTSTFSVSRYLKAAGTNGTVLTTLSSGNKGAIYKVSNRYQLFNEANWGKEFRLFCNTGLNMRVGDVIEAGTYKYGVAGKNEIPDMFESRDEHDLFFIVRKSGDKD